MSQDFLPELVSEPAFSRGLAWVVMGWSGAWLIAGAVLALVLRRRIAAAWCGYAVLCGWAAWAGWGLFVHVTRVDLTTGEAGLHRVSVLLVCLAIFLVGGASMGVVAALLRRAGLRAQNGSGNQPRPRSPGRVRLESERGSE